MSGSPRRLTRDAVLGAALAVIDDSGLEACTMRAVAAELGVEAMSLYWHVPGKEALLDGVVELVLAEVAAEGDEPGDWRARTAAFAEAFRDVILRHPNAVPLLAGRALGAYAAAARMAERGIVSLEEAGFDRATAIRATRTIARYVVGFTMAEAGAAPVPEGTSPPPLVEDLIARVAHDDPGELFSFGLETLLDGLEARLSRG